MNRWIECQSTETETIYFVLSPRARLPRTFWYLNSKVHSPCTHWWVKKIRISIYQRITESFHGKHIHLTYVVLLADDQKLSRCNWTVQSERFTPYLPTRSSTSVFTSVKNVSLDGGAMLNMDWAMGYGDKSRGQQCNEIWSAALLSSRWSVAAKHNHVETN